MRNKGTIYGFRTEDGDEFYLVRDETKKKFYRKKFDYKESAHEFGFDKGLKLPYYLDMENEIYDFEIDTCKHIFSTDGMSKRKLINFLKNIHNTIINNPLGIYEK